MSLNPTSTYLSNTSRDGDSTTSLGGLFQCLITLLVKKFFLISWPIPTLEFYIGKREGSGEEREKCLLTNLIGKPKIYYFHFYLK